MSNVLRNESLNCGNANTTHGELHMYRRGHNVATLNRDLGFDFNVVPTASIAPRAAANPSSKLRFLGQSYTILLACTYSSEIVRSGAARAVAAAAVTSVTDPPGFYSSFGQSNIMVMYRTDFSM